MHISGLQKFTYGLTLSSGDEGTVPSDLSTAAAGNTVASSSQLGPQKSCSTGKHNWHTTTMKVIRNSDGQEVWDISSEDCSDSGSNAAPPTKKLCKHGRRTKTTVFHTAGEEVWDISSEEYSYNGSEGQELM